MKLVVAIVGLLLLAAWIEQELVLRARKRRERARDRCLRELEHITGPIPKWWKEPPNDGPEGDY